jgi:hypothetical protein
MWNLFGGFAILFGGPSGYNDKKERIMIGR